MKKQIAIDAKTFDRLFDEGGDMSDYLDMESSRLFYGPEGSGTMIKRDVLVELSLGNLIRTTRRAQEKGCTVSELIESWIKERLEREE